MTLPFVSCLMPTFNRFPHYGHLVEEAVESFLLQDYNEYASELIILNDTPGQTLAFNHPLVRVVNTPRFRTLGEKRNALVAMARGDVLLPYDDDDVSLPLRVSQAVEKLYSFEVADGVAAHHASPQYGYWNPRAYWYDEGNGVVRPSSFGYCHNCSAFTREAFVRAGGYPMTSGDEDAHMDRRLRASNATVQGPLPPSEWSYVYRWNVSPRHLSGRPDLQQHYDDLGTAPVAPGEFLIRPRWRRDYAAEAKAAAARA